MSYARFALYYLPPAGAMADFGAAWMGWDVAKGTPARRFDEPGLDDITMTPARYGFHGTLKPPFRLAEGHDAAGLAAGVDRLARAAPPARCDGLRLESLGRFLALVPAGEAGEIGALAARCVTGLDPFRARPDAAELARRRKAGLTARQEALLTRWGYPYVFEEFHFHLTLTGALPDADHARWRDVASARLPELPAPFILDAVALVGEREDGLFELIHRYALRG